MALTRIIVAGLGGATVSEEPRGAGGPVRPDSHSRHTWNDLGRIHEVDNLGDADEEILEQIYDVLKRHNVEDRFGITLLHSHFDMDEGEVLVETVDAESGTMTVQTRHQSDFDSGELVPTSWRFIGNHLVPLQYCHRPKDSVFHQR